MLRKYKYKLNPTKEQEVWLTRIARVPVSFAGFWDLNAAINIERAGERPPLKNVFGENADTDQMKVWAVLCELHDEGSYAL